VPSVVTTVMAGPSVDFPHFSWEERGTVVDKGWRYANDDCVVRRGS
jgi:hypothetical protein